MSDGSERRKFKRRYLMYYSRIFDLTPEGAMIISEEPIDSKQVFQFRMDLPEELSEKAFLDFEAESVWCKRDIDPNFYDTGIRLINITTEDRNILDYMIQEYGFRDANFSSDHIRLCGDYRCQKRVYGHIRSRQQRL